MKKQNIGYILLFVLTIGVIILAGMGFFGSITPGQGPNENYITCSTASDCPATTNYHGATLNKASCANGYCTYNGCTANCDMTIYNGDKLCDWVECTSTSASSTTKTTFANCNTAHYTQACKDGNVVWKDNCGNWKDISEKCDYGCSGLWCNSAKLTTVTTTLKTTATTQRSCYDSDGSSTAYSTAGYIVDKYSDLYEDECFWAATISTVPPYFYTDTITEYFCNPDGTAGKNTKRCTNKCQIGYAGGGYCNVESTATGNSCEDSDGGLAYNKQGTVKEYVNNQLSFTRNDNCLGDGKTVSEYYCSGTKAAGTTYACPDKCQGGQCVTGITKTCADYGMVTEKVSNSDCVESWYDGLGWCYICIAKRGSGTTKTVTATEISCSGKKDGAYCGSSTKIILCQNGVEIWNNDCTTVKTPIGQELAGKCQSVESSYVWYIGKDGKIYNPVEIANSINFRNAIKTVTGPNALCVEKTARDIPVEPKTTQTLTTQGTTKTETTQITEPTIPKPRYASCDTVQDCIDYYEDCDYNCVSSVCKKINSGTGATCSGAKFLPYPDCQWDTSGCGATATCPAHSTLLSNGNCQCDAGYTVSGKSCIEKTTTTIDWTLVAIIAIIAIVVPLTYVVLSKGKFIKIVKKKR